MDKIVLDIWVGVVGGVLTSALLYALNAFVDAKLSPWFREMRYQGIKIDGKWDGLLKEDDAKSEAAFSLFLRQSATHLEGLYTVRFTSPENSFELAFQARGYVWEGYVMLTFLPIDRRVTSCANGLFKIAGGGIRLEGQACFRNVNSESVAAHMVTLSREGVGKISPSKAPEVAST